jgi:hypothetical protein
MIFKKRKKRITAKDIVSLYSKDESFKIRISFEDEDFGFSATFDKESFLKSHYVDYEVLEFYVEEDIIEIEIRFFSDKQLYKMRSN